MNPPKVSVIINCLNGEQYLREALDSIFCQTYDDWEVIFWDNASTDKSVEIARGYGERVRIFNSETTYVLGKARNLASKQSLGEFIAFLDCDDIWLPSKLERQMELFDRNPELGLVFSDCLLFNNDRTICQLYQKFKPPRHKIFEALLKKYFLSIPSAVLRKSAVPGEKWFDDRLSILEEFDLFHRIAYVHEVDYVDEPLAKHRVHRQSNTFKDYSIIADERELVLGEWMREFPGILGEFPAGFEVFNNKTLQHKAVGKWIEGVPWDARKILKSIKNPGLLVFSLHVFTFFPPALLFPLISLNHLLKNWFDWSRQ